MEVVLWTVRKGSPWRDLPTHSINRERRRLWFPATVDF